MSANEKNEIYHTVLKSPSPSLVSEKKLQCQTNQSLHPLTWPACANSAYGLMAHLAKRGEFHRYVVNELQVKQRN